MSTGTRSPCPRKGPPVSPRRRALRASVAALVHDASLRDQPELVDAVVAAAGLALENERLQAELRARLEELRASRFRLVETADVERRRLERNLHDGAQQRLVALSLSLALAQREFGSSRGHRDARADALGPRRCTRRAPQARTRHPSFAPHRSGPEAALEALANRSLVPVELDGLPDERLPDGVEAAAYYLVAEALTNVTKYAQASMASVRVERENGQRDRRGQRRRHRRSRCAPGKRAPRARRPRRGARRAPRPRQPAGCRNAHPGGNPLRHCERERGRARDNCRSSISGV